LDGLYAHFVGLVRADVAALGALDTEDAGGTVPAWEGAGARLLGVLSVARGWLTAEQLRAMAGIRVWPEDVIAVLARFRPFLDSAGDGMQLFHSSVGEYLTSPQALAEHPDLAVNAQRWHRSVARSYRGNAKSWRAVRWPAVDDYGLVHLAEHIVGDTGAEKTALLSLANPEFRAGLARRFGSDVLFKGVVELASHQLRDCADLKTARPQVGQELFQLRI
jgi:hypothetical protein